MLETYNWCVEHKEEIIAVYTAIVTIASIIIKWVPELDKDNKFKGFVKFVGRYIALNRK